MAWPIALQLYTVREQLTRHFGGVMERVAAIGYDGVETSWASHIPAREAGRTIRSYGLEIPSAYTHLPVGERKNQVLDMVGALGARRIVASLGKSDLESADKVKRACEQVNQARVNAGRLGFPLGLHNHWWEFAELAPGRTVFDEMLDNLDTQVFFEVDTYWAQTAGVDPVDLLRRLGPRAPLLHLKDGPCVRREPMVALGAGKLDIPAILQVAAGSAEWLIVELDACATDMLEAVEKSFLFLDGLRAARGRTA
jgi:sugar phosphate isomerase/epimerase